MLNRRSLLLTAGVLLVGRSGNALAQSTERVVGADWGWLSDYAYLWAQWTVNCPRDRRCQVGMGIFSHEACLFGGQVLTPLGSSGVSGIRPTYP